MTYLTKERNEKPQPFDIFFAETATEYETKKHYYVCIYAQSLDPNNRLEGDVYGLFITSNQKYFNIPNDYNVKISLNGKDAFVCCDKLTRIKLTEKIEVKFAKLTPFEKYQIKYHFNKFFEEVKRQAGMIRKEDDCL